MGGPNNTAESPGHSNPQIIFINFHPRGLHLVIANTHTAAKKTSMLLCPRVAMVVLLLFSATSALPAEPAGSAAPSAEEDVVRLPEIAVTTTAHCNFGFGIVIFGDVKAGMISRILIDEVIPGSDAARFGLQKGDEILSVNGTRVSEMKGGMKGGSDLFRLLINRPPGERIDVEVAVRVVKRVALIAGPSL